MGAHFDVDVQDDVVIKKPKRNTIHEIERMVELQNWLAERIDGIPTAEVYNGAIYEQKIYGSTCVRSTRRDQSQTKQPYSLIGVSATKRQKSLTE